jgi:hypothetical protein
MIYDPLTASELLKLPREQRSKILKEMAAETTNDPEYIRSLTDFEAFGEADLYDETP